MKFNKRKKDILNGNIPEQIVLLAVPYIGTYLLQQAYQFADSIVLGKFAGTAAMAAVGGSATMIINIILNFIIGISTGTMVLIAQSYGSNDIDRVEKTVKTGMFIAFTFTGLISILCFIFSKPILIWMDVPVETFEYSLIYLRMYLLSLVPYAIYTTGMYILRAVGNSNSSIFFTIIISASKIILDLLLTVVFKLGIWGVSISTLVSYLICAIVVLFILKYSSSIYSYSLKDFGFDTNALVQTFKIGTPIAIQSSIFALTSAYMSMKINVHGTNAIAAFSAFNNVDNFYWSFSNAIATSILTIVGQNYGNNNLKRVKDTLKNGIIILIGVSIVLGGIVYFACPYILRIFTNDAEVIAIASQMNKMICLTYTAYVLIESISSTIKGCGDSKNSMIISIFGVCVVRLCYLSIFTFTKPIQVMYCYPISWTISSIIYLIYYLRSPKYKF